MKTVVDPCLRKCFIPSDTDRKLKTDLERRSEAEAVLLA